jgi:hypothetical protein
MRCDRFDFFFKLIVRTGTSEGYCGKGEPFYVSSATELEPDLHVLTQTIPVAAARLPVA